MKNEKATFRSEAYTLHENGPILWETGVSSFRDRCAFLSNFYAAEVTFEGLTYSTTEAAFQAAKCTDPAAGKIISAGSSRNIKKEMR